MSAALKTMLDAICIGLLGGAVLALLLDVIGYAEAMAKFFHKLPSRIHFRGVPRLPHFNAKFKKYEKN